MQKFFILVIALFALGVRPAAAQVATPAPAASKTPAVGKRLAVPAAPTPAARRGVVRVPMSTPLPVKAEASKKSLWEKIFGRRKTPTPASVATASTPAATPAPRGRRMAKKDDGSKPTPVKPEDTKPQAEKPPSEKSAPVVAKTQDDEKHAAAPAAPAATPSPVRKTGKGRPTAESRNVPPTASAEEEVQEKYKYDIAKAKALTDSEVLQLKEKAESAVDEDEGRKAQRAYTRALFDKMRSIDRSIKERADRIEAGILRRLEGTE